MASVYDCDYDKVVEAVIFLGSAQWNLFAKLLGVNPARVEAITSGRPTNDGKLQAIINSRELADGKINLKKKLLDACAKLPQSILGAVEEYLLTSKKPVADAQPTESYPGVTEFIRKESEADAPNKDGLLDVVIVTAVEVEQKAVEQVLNGAGCKTFQPFQIRKSSGEVVVGGVVTSLELVNEQMEKTFTFTVGIFGLLEMGQTGASDALNAIEFGIQSHQVSSSCFLVMIGMCAGNPDKVQVGDIMTPHLITKESGKHDAGMGGLQAEAKGVSISHVVKTAVQAALPLCYGYTWIDKYLPADVKNTPSPRYLQDVILDSLRNADEEMSVTQLYTQIAEAKKDWPTKRIISKQVVKEALHILRDTRAFVIENNKKFVLSESGKSYIEEIECESDFPQPDKKYPKIKNNPMIAGDLVRVGMEATHWEELLDHVAQRKAGGLEMEGYGFLDYAEKHLPDTRRWFVKVVTDYATKESKMDYYQQYGACLASAFFLHVLQINPSLAARK